MSESHLTTPPPAGKPAGPRPDFPFFSPAARRKAARSAGI